MYEELVRQLRTCCDENTPCAIADCGYEPFGNEDCIDQLMRKAAEAIEELIKVIQNHNFLESLVKPCWTSVAEGLPDAYEDVILKFPNNQAVGFCDRDGCWAVYSGDGFYTEVADNEPKPTHWIKKLPEPPKEEV